MTTETRHTIERECKSRAFFCPRCLAEMRVYYTNSEKWLIIECPRPGCGVKAEVGA